MINTLKINIPVLLAMMIVLACGDNPAPREEKKQTDSTAVKASPVEKKTIVFMGNSITAGYGLHLSQAFPALIQKRIDSLQQPYTVVNAGVSGEVSADGLARIDWVLKQPVDIFVLELGGNDGLRGIPVSETRKNLKAIIDKVREKYASAQIVLAGMQMPPNLGRRYTEDFRNMYPELAKESNAKLIPFLLEGVGGEAELNMDDGIHPTAEGHQILAENVWKVLGPKL